ncbi:carboxylesterase/lipase family protein [Rhodococcus sp. NCIMB 12038]|uniref:carboxylesterase/lipase family protein n=1 Tax=Rhodococcus sp. NCIMB 12038 TaxID=933800 RepID=UPI000B3D3079|nr:carboxylesterase/lipase family protein [Rhodococcus sp. NCIMB 12038]OUS93957.1 carboxylesterase [Rhodococcus sp. NCIMB 12038]
MASDTLTTGTLVRTTAGVVRGRRVGDLVAWRGIPYAAPPVGPLRLRAPQPVTPWSGELDATEFGDAAVQHKKFTALRPGKYQPSSENCLTLNVLATPGTSGARPVMVFIHGGAYTLGMSATALYGGQSLVRRGDIVYVSINYRLGSLGYLDFTQFSTPERPFDSNLGLRDQVAALEWVQRNIAEFGGDPDNVTVFGESAGANAVTTLMTTPAAKGLFARAIAESPPVASAYHPERAARWSREFLEIAGVPLSEAATWLETADPADFVAAGTTLAHRGADEEPGTRAFAPVVDGFFLPTHPLDSFASGSGHPVPLIIGTNRHEGRVFPRFLNILPTDPTRIDKMFSHVDASVKERAIAAYPGYPGRRAAADLGGDVTFWEPSVLCAQGHTTVAPTYSYRYDFAPRLLHVLGLGATHATELYAVFGLTGPWARLLTALGGRRGLRAVTDTVQSHWLHFARHGTPAPGWPRYSPERRETLVIDDTSRVENDPLGQRRRAWLGYEHRR